MRVVGVVRATDSVEVVGFHQLNVLQHGLAADDVARLRVVLVAVHASDRQGLPVEQHSALYHLDRPEAYRDAERLGHRTPLLRRRLSSASRRRRWQGDDQRVEVGLLCAPELDVTCLACDARNSHIGSPAHQRRREGANPRRSVALRSAREQLALQRPTGGQRGPPSVQLGLQPEFAVRASVDLHILDVLGRSCVEVDVAGDPCEPPHVLILEVRPRVPAQDLEGNHVPSLLQVWGQLEHGLQLAVGAESELDSVEPNLAATAHRADVKEHLIASLEPLGGGVERAAVSACRIVLRIRAAVLDPRRVGLEAVVDVGVDRVAVAIELPIRWHGHVAPSTVFEARQLKPLRDLAGPVRPRELPSPVQREETARAAQLRARLRELCGLVREEGCPSRLAAHTHRPGVEPLGLLDVLNFPAFLRAVDNHDFRWLTSRVFLRASKQLPHGSRGEGGRAAK
mmetsp:Transcript_89589/g.232246  ORF Transcript_89589/g.232246 Transcript_89589/m.232246 type:complete len:455 (+) Transcript_89589:2620-3984(+)